MCYLTALDSLVPKNEKIKICCLGKTVVLELILVSCTHDDMTMDTTTQATRPWLLHIERYKKQKNISTPKLSD